MLVIILSTALIIFIILFAVGMAYVLKILNHLKKITEHAENVAESVETAANTVEKAASPVAILKLVSNIVDSASKFKRKKE